MYVIKTKTIHGVTLIKKECEKINTVFKTQLEPIFKDFIIEYEIIGEIKNEC